ncbi:hypothetical protein RchiOBHm_Chr6g0303521 [Rosa chinensis]|uniref:Uncharacterized protein n=1 Tax=Rosa chinensis TaxID=74649 RepID=A0A2P6PZA1_ROSCH|nr:hypothetical protein RchiOBHm_Chr6g0303521 [Rosa chinensis]
MQKCGRRSRRFGTATMAALVLSSETRDTSDVIVIKLRANMIEVGGLRQKFNRNS